eukprot:m.259154 g.259154  ORF g.259154 m.259154 type:complete len:373 (+) comp15550_c0_seq2:38-1156(+)
MDRIISPLKDAIQWLGDQFNKHPLGFTLVALSFGVPALRIVRGYIAKPRGLKFDIVVSSLHVYPIKSGAGLSLKSATLDPYGFAWDRRFVLMDKNETFMSQRATPKMAKLQTALLGNDLVVVHDKMPTALFLAHAPELAQSVDPQHILTPGSVPLVGRDELEAANVAPRRTATVKIWDTPVSVLRTTNTHNSWFSEALQQEVTFLQMKQAGEHKRPIIDRAVPDTDAHVTLADGFPILLVSVASAYDVTTRLNAPISMARFRPNIVVQGTPPFEEDAWSQVQVGSTILDVVKPCARCTMPCVDPLTGKKDPWAQPSKIMEQYHGVGGATYMGQNCIQQRNQQSQPNRVWKIQCGDLVQVLGLKCDAVTKLSH